MVRMQLQTWLSAGRGRAKALANHLQIPPSMVSKMASGEKPVPLDHCPAIEAFSEGEVTCEDLRPDKVGYFAYLSNRAIPAAAESAPARVKPEYQAELDAMSAAAEARRAAEIANALRPAAVPTPTGAKHA